MPWIRLYVVVEGQAERLFVDSLLKPHLVSFEVETRTRVVVTNRKLDARGGILDFLHIRDDLVRLMREDRHPEAKFTTMIDLYALPSQFPGWSPLNPAIRPIDRVRVLEEAFFQNMGDNRFLPHIQLHEFEALLFCDLTELERRIEGSRAGLAALRNQVSHLAPEDINEGVQTAPSKRIIQHVPAYKRQKVRVGGPAAASIGLPRLRQSCPHFRSWIERLEALGSQ